MRPNDQRRRLVIPVVPTLLICLAVSSCSVDTVSEARSHTNARPQRADDAALWIVDRVIDGDTVEARRGDRVRTVRLIGVDTPETVHPTQEVECFGPEASAFAEATLLGRRVTLEFDPTQGRRDYYGRTLAYVWIAGTPPRLFNLMALRRGFALEYTFDREYVHHADFVRAENAARSATRGVWNCPTPGHNRFSAGRTTSDRPRLLDVRCDATLATL